MNPEVRKLLKDAQIALIALQQGEKLAEALRVAVEELEYFIDFACRQCEFEGDEEAGRCAVRQSRQALAEWEAGK